jgi:hypothetical protein
MTGPLAAYAEPRSTQRRLHRRHKHVHLIGRRAEEDKVSCGPIDNSHDDKRRATREREPLGFRQPGHDASHLLLK